MNRHLLVLDLDETLVFASETPLDHPPDCTVPPYAVYFRPALFDFIDTVSRHYELAVWTSSSPAYARAVCRAVFGDHTPLTFIWASDRCTATRDMDLDTWALAKRLRKLRRIGYDLHRVVMVDDSPEKHTKNYGNLVRVTPFLGDTADRELVLLARYLIELAAQTDIRAVEKRFWRSASDWRDDSE